MFLGPGGLVWTYLGSISKMRIVDSWLDLPGGFTRYVDSLGTSLMS